MSIWNINEDKKIIKSLTRNIDVDTLIIGAGITGMTTAYFLKDNKNVVIVDANNYGHGVTLNTTAKLTYLQERVYTKIKTLCGFNTAKTYLQSQLDAIKLIKDIIEKENIDCNFTRTPSYIFANTKKEIKPLTKEINFLKNNNIDIKKDDLPLKITSYESYKVDDTYTFHPLKYLDNMYKILRDKVTIYEKTKITNIKRCGNIYKCYTENNCITAKNVVIACHYPFFLFPMLMPIKAKIEKSYIIASKVENNPNFSLISTNTPTYSCRFYKDDEGNNYQISLSESHNTAFKQNDEYHFNRVKQIFNLQDENIVEMYSNVDIITFDHMPYVGKLKDYLYLCTGYNTWGMTNSVISSKIISDLIKNKNNKYVKTFNPKRLNLAFFLNLPIIVFSQIKSFFGPKINKKKKWYSSKVRFFTKNGSSLASYTDEFNKEHIVYNKCPHLKCSLIFNETEKTWDCPCHSSRFDIDGKCIKGPSLYDIRYKE